MKHHFKRLKLGMCSLVGALTLLFSAQVVKADYQGELAFNTTYKFEKGTEYEYSVTLPKSGALNINFIASESNGKSRINMTDSYGTSITKNWNYDGYTGSYTSVYNLKAGSYKISFHGGAGEPQAAGNMRCTFTSANETYAENLETTNDDASVASEVSNPASASIIGQFALNDTTDCYTFKIRKASDVSISFISGLSAVNLQLYNEDLDLEYRENSIAAGSHKYTYKLPSGTYYLVLKNADTKTTGNYTLAFKSSALKKSSVSKVKSSKSKTATVYVKKVKGVTGYQIQVARNSRFTKSKKTVNVTSTKTTIKKLTSKKTYYVRVRTYTVLDNKKKCYSDWSNVKKIKIK